MRRPPLLLLAVLAGCLLLSACPRRGGLLQRPAGESRTRFTVEEREVRFALPSGEPVTLGADLYRPEGDAQAPAVLLIPGGGRASRQGTQPGDGFHNYAAPVDVSAGWAEELAAHGMFALTLDKRTCTPADDRRCRRNPTTDLDEEGPLALARDVDAACDLLAEERDISSLVLFAHGQGAAVALSSSCLQQAAAVVLVAPIPRRVDRVLVDSLVHQERLTRERAKRTSNKAEAASLNKRAAQLKDLAASREAMFESMTKGQFTDDAVVLGATLAFWRGWVELTRDSEQLVLAPGAPRLIVLGSDDAQYAPRDRKVIAAWGEREGIRSVIVEGADHHLLQGEELRPEATEAVISTLLEILQDHARPAL